MKRRDFLKSTLPAAALMHAGLHGRFVQGEPQEAKTPVDQPYDLIVIGGNLSGCFAALHAARMGLRVLLIERRTFLGTEITATMRPWLKRDGFQKLPRRLKDLFLPTQELSEVGIPFDPQHPSAFFGDEVPLFMGTVKKQLMQTLLQSDVDVLVGTGVWGILAGGEQAVATGLALASKFGIHMARGKRFVDSASCASRSTDRQVAYTVELYGVDPRAASEVEVPKSIDLLDNKVLVHKGKRKPGQCYVEFRFVPDQEDTEDEARLRTEAVTAHLIKKHCAFFQSKRRSVGLGDVSNSMCHRCAS